MLKNSWKLILASLAAISLSLYLIDYFYPSSHPLGGAHLKQSPRKIIETGRAIIMEYQINPDNYYEELRFDQNEKLIRDLQNEVGLVKANEYLRESIPGYHWRLNYTIKENDDKTPSETGGSIYKKLEFKFDTRANLFELWIDIPDTIPLLQFEIDEANRHVRQFIEKYSSFKDLKDTLRADDRGKEESFKHQSNIVLGSRRTDFDFNWQESLVEPDRKVEITASVTGSVISKIKIDYRLMNSDEGWAEVTRPVTTVLLMLIVMVLVIYLIYKKSRNDEIHFGLALKLAIVMALLVLVEQVFQMRGFLNWENMFSIFLLPLLMGGTFVVLFATAESVCREVWPDSLIPFDLIVNGHFMHSRIGAGLLRGVMAGSILFAGSLLLIRLLDTLTPVTTVMTGDTNLRILQSDSPAIPVLIHSLWASIYVLVIFIIFLPSYLQSSLRRLWLTIPVTSAIFALINGNMLQPFIPGLIIQSLVYAALIWIFIRYDILAGLVALLSLSLLEYMPVIWSADYGGMLPTFIMLGILFLIAVYSLLTRDSISDLNEIQPVLSRLINERQRMKQELEIAR